MKNKLDILNQHYINIANKNGSYNNINSTFVTSKF